MTCLGCFFPLRRQYPRGPPGTPFTCHLRRRWCKRLGHQTPCVYSCIWRAGGANDEFFLGASLEGFNVDAERTGTWEQHLRMGAVFAGDEERLRLLG